MAEQQRPTAEERFRSSLEDAVAVVTRLQETCQTTAELLGVLQLALDNDGQLRLLMQTVLAPAQKGR